MKLLPLMFSILFVLNNLVYCDDASLLKQVAELEKRITELETRLAPVLEQERVKTIAKRQKALAHERMIMDAEIYSRHDLNMIEKIYHTASQDWEAEDAKKAVALLTERYSHANRTGCAVLTLARNSNDEEKLDYLKLAIEKYSGCFYSSGVQVGPYARLYLAMLHKKSGRDKDASKLFEEIRSHHPEAIDHKEQLLTSHLDGMD